MTRAKGFRGFLQWFFLPDVETLLNASEEIDQRLDMVGKNMSVLDRSVGVLDRSVGVLDESLSSLDAGIAQLVDQGLARLNDGMRQLDENMARIHKGMQQLNLGMDQLNKDTDERERDLTERLAHLKAKLVDDHARAMGEIASLLDEHAFVEREQAMQEEKLREARARSRAMMTGDEVPGVSSAAVSGLREARYAPAQEERSETRQREPELKEQSREAAERGRVEPSAVALAKQAPVDQEEPLGRPRGMTRLEAVPAPSAQPTPSYAQQMEEEQQSRAAALADPVATMTRLSSILGLSRTPEPQGGTGNPALDFAAILEGIKKSSSREQGRGIQQERRAL